MGKTITLKESKQSVIMKCPSVKNVKNAFMSGEDEITQTIKLLAAVCNMTEQEVEDLPFPDYMQLQEALQVFLGAQARSVHPVSR